MAKKTTQARALSGPRQMTKQIPMSHPIWNDDAQGWLVDDMPGWQSITTAHNTGVYAETYFDLSGYELSDLTTVLRSVRVQDPGLYLFSGQTKVFSVYDILSTERLSSTDLVEVYDNHRLEVMSAPGMSRGPLDRDQIPFGLYRMFGHNSTNVGLPELMVNVRTSRFGSGEPVAVQKLWVYRIVILIGLPAGPQTLTIPASTFVVNAHIIKEKDIPYFFRLKRSYELANQGE
jgi:hypothetical protein